MTPQPAHSKLSIAYDRFSASTPGKITKIAIGAAGGYMASEYAALGPYETMAVTAIGGRCGYEGLRNSWRAFKSKYAGWIAATAVVCGVAAWARTTDFYQYFVPPAGLFDTAVEGVGMPVPEMTRIARTVVKKTEYKIYGSSPFGPTARPAAAASAASAPSAPASSARRTQRRASAPAA